MSDAIATLSTAIIEQESDRRAAIPPDREAALVALVRAQVRLYGEADPANLASFDLIHGSRLENPGGSLAFSLVLAAEDRALPDGGWSAQQQPTRYGNDNTRTANLDAWASGFMHACGDLADARQVLAHLASGFMRAEARDDGSIAAWIATKRFPPHWRERIDLAWWDARTHRPDDDDAANATNWQFGYLPDAMIAEIPAHIWTEAVRGLTERYSDLGPIAPVPECDIRDTIATTLGITPGTAVDILSALTLDATNAAWHATVPGIAAAPFVRLSPTTLMPSTAGLRSEPLLFLARELRRRDAQHWHNAAHQREDTFRRDLGSIFADKRFVHAPNRIQLRRDSGTFRTDIDASIFDRKTGTLALFELKAQDPFSRSPEELGRRRDSLLAANRQLSSILDWTKQHKPDEILDRIDHQTAKRFHVQRVLPFVLARTLVRFNDGAVPDKRAAWGTWPDVLRLHDAGALEPASANPLQTLFTRLHGATEDPPVPKDTATRTIRIGGVSIEVCSHRPPG